MNFIDIRKPLPRGGLNYGKHNLVYYPSRWSINIPPPNLHNTRKNYVTVKNRIRIFGILPKVTKEDLHEEFSFFGPIAAIVIVRNQYHNRNGFAFVTYHLEKHAQLALQGSSARFFKGNIIFVNSAIQNEKNIDYQEEPIKRIYSLKTLLYIKEKYDKFFLDQVNDVLYVNPCHGYLEEIDATIPRHLKRSTFCNNSFSDTDSCSTSSTSADDESFSDDESLYSFGTVTEIPGTPANSESTSENSWKLIPDYFHGLHKDNDLQDFIYSDSQYFGGTPYVEESNYLDLHEDENPMTLEDRYYNKGEIIYLDPISQHLEVSSYPENEYDFNYEYPTWEEYQEEFIENVNRDIFYVDPNIDNNNHLNEMNVQIDDDMQLIPFQPNYRQTCPTVYEYPVNIKGYAGARLIDEPSSRIILPEAQFKPISPSLYSMFYNFDIINHIFNQLGIAEIANYATRQIKTFQGINSLVPPVSHENKINDYMQKFEYILTNLLEYLTIKQNERNDQSCNGVHIIEISDQDNIEEPEFFSKEMERTSIKNITLANRTIDIYRPALIVDLEKQFTAIEAQFSISPYQFQQLETDTDNYEELESKVVYETTTQCETLKESPNCDCFALSGHDVTTQVSEVCEYSSAVELDAANVQTMETQIPCNSLYEDGTKTLYVTYPNVTKSEK